MAMSAPYSYDLRQKAVEAVKRGERKTTVSKMFNISRNTLDLWLKRERQTGDCQAITDYQQGCRHKITDWSAFEPLSNSMVVKLRQNLPSCGVRG